jgi:hypothetical protein
MNLNEGLRRVMTRKGEVIERVPLEWLGDKVAAKEDASGSRAEPRASLYKSFATSSVHVSSSALSSLTVTRRLASTAIHRRCPLLGISIVARTQRMCGYIYIARIKKVRRRGGKEGECIREDICSRKAG